MLIFIGRNIFIKIEVFWVDNIPEIDCTQESWDQKLITLSSKTGDYITLTKV